MIISGRIRKSVSFCMLGVSAVFWILLLINPTKTLAIRHCAVTTCPPTATFQTPLAMNSILALLAGWTLMVVTMMLPKLIMPIQHIYARSFRRQRFLSILLFVFGYAFVWTLVGIFMIAATLELRPLSPNSYLPAIGLGIIAVIWQFSPIKQRCLNRGHDHRSLTAFGLAANRDALVFGVMHGVWCVGSGWALMLLPALLPAGHNLAMIVVAFIMVGEHFEHPQTPRWSLNFRGKLFRMIIAQTQIKWKHMHSLNWFSEPFLIQPIK